MTDSTSEQSAKLYKGRFNWYGDVIPNNGKYLHCHAASIGQAFNFLCKQVSVIVKRSLFDVRHYFYDSNKYIIEEVIEDDRHAPKSAEQNK